MERDLTHAEAAEAFRLFGEEIGPRADFSIYLNHEISPHRGRLGAAIYPDGVGKDSVCRVGADTYADLLVKLKAEWAKHGDKRSAETVRKMALAIISITADEGSCSEFSLCKAFSAAEVKTYGDRACEEATRIAGNGPFSIVRADEAGIVDRSAA